MRDNKYIHILVYSGDDGVAYSAMPIGYKTYLSLIQYSGVHKRIELSNQVLVLTGNHEGCREHFQHASKCYVEGLFTQNDTSDFD